jgi:hypothetical protein
MDTNKFSDRQLGVREDMKHEQLVYTCSTNFADVGHVVAID